MLFLCFYGSLLDGKTGLVVLDVGIEAGHVFSRGSNLHTSVTYAVDYDSKEVKDFLLQYRALYNTEPSRSAYSGYPFVLK